MSFEDFSLSKAWQDFKNKVDSELKIKSQEKQENREMQAHVVKTVQEKYQKNGVTLTTPFTDTPTNSEHIYVLERTLSEQERQYGIYTTQFVMTISEQNLRDLRDILNEFFTEEESN